MLRYFLGAECVTCGVRTQEESACLKGAVIGSSLTERDIADETAQGLPPLASVIENFIDCLDVSDSAGDLAVCDCANSRMRISRSEVHIL